MSLIDQSLDSIKGQALDKELDLWLDKVGNTEELYPIKGCKAVIAPFVANLRFVFPLIPNEQACWICILWTSCRLGIQKH
jgi:hypothetical protein